MMSSISWADYLTVVTLFMAVYYLVTITFFYSRDLQRFLAGKRKGQVLENPERVEISQAPEQRRSGVFNMEAEARPSQETNYPLEADINLDVDKLRFLLKQEMEGIQGKQYNREELKVLLQMVLKEYSAFSDDASKATIQELIIEECKNQDSILLTEEEIMDLINEVIGNTNYQETPDLQQ